MSINKKSFGIANRTYEEKIRERKKQNRTLTEIYNHFSNNKTRAFTLNEIYKQVIIPKKLIITYKGLTQLFHLWKDKKILKHNRPYYTINLKSKEKPNWTKPKKEEIK